MGLLSGVGADDRSESASITRTSGATNVLSHQKNVSFQTSSGLCFERTIRTESAIQSGSAHRAQITPTGVLPAPAKIPPRMKSQKNPSP
jgi:hypothetical protein